MSIKLGLQLLFFLLIVVILSFFYLTFFISEKDKANISKSDIEEVENSLNEKDVRFKSDILKIFNNYNSIFKFVINNYDDITEVLEIIHQINISNERVYLMPEGKIKSELENKYYWLIDLCKKYNFKYSHRLHIELYGDKRGV